MTEYITNIENLLGIPSGELTWFIIGFGGQFLFMMRFVIQWWYSEKAKQVVIPVAFFIGEFITWAEFYIFCPRLCHNRQHAAVRVILVKADPLEIFEHEMFAGAQRCDISHCRLPPQSSSLYGIQRIFLGY